MASNWQKRNYSPSWTVCNDGDDDDDDDDDAEMCLRFSRVLRASQKRRRTTLST